MVHVSRKQRSRNNSFVQADTFIEKKKSQTFYSSHRNLNFDMIIINFLFAFPLVNTKVFYENANQKRMVPMFESTVPVSSLVNYYSQVF